MSTNLFTPKLRYTNKETCNSSWTFIDGQNVSEIKTPEFIKNLFTSFDDSRYGKMGKDLIEGVPNAECTLGNQYYPHGTDSALAAYPQGSCDPTESCRNGDVGTPGLTNCTPGLAADTGLPLPCHCETIPFDEVLEETYCMNDAAQAAARARIEVACCGAEGCTPTTCELEDCAGVLLPYWNLCGGRLVSAEPNSPARAAGEALQGVATACGATTSNDAPAANNGGTPDGQGTNTCSPNPCQNGGTCNSSDGTCNCPEGWTGTNCDSALCSDGSELISNITGPNGVGVCCTGGNCGTGGLKGTCDSSCAAVIVPFLENCGEAIDREDLQLDDGGALAAFRTFANGCPDPANNGQTTDCFDSEAQVADSENIARECCPEADDCPGGLLQTCSDGCRSVVMDYWTRCGGQLQGADGDIDVITQAVSVCGREAANSGGNHGDGGGGASTCRIDSSNPAPPCQSGQSCMGSDGASQCTEGQNDCQCVPDVDCVGSWSACGADCNKTYSIATVASGGGTPCPAQDGDTEVCAGGEGECPTENTCSSAFEGAKTGKDQPCNLNAPDSAGWTKGNFEEDPLWGKYKTGSDASSLNKDESDAIKALITNNSSMDDSGNPEQMNNEVWNKCCTKAECTDEGWANISLFDTDSGSWAAWAESLGCTLPSSDTS